MTVHDKLTTANNKKRPYSSRRNWSRTETRTLLVFVNNRKEEFHHKLKKKVVYDHLVEDLTSSGVSEKETPFTVDEIKNKIKTLMSAYKTVVDSNNRSGNGPSIAPYKDLMDEIYRDGNPAPDTTEYLARSVGIGRIEPQTTEEDIFDSMIKVSLEENDDLEPYTSNTSSTSTPVVKRKRISEKQKLQNDKLEFAKEMVELKETDKCNRMLKREMAREKWRDEKRKMHEEKREWYKEVLNSLAE